MSAKENASYNTLVLNDQGGSQMSVSEGRTSTLRAQEHGHQPIIVEKVYENHSQDTRYKDLGDVCQTVSATWGGGGNNTPFVVKQVYDGSRRHNYEPFGDVCETVQSYYGTGGGNTPMVQESNTIVRRLTPLECERLQGYPDGWTDIGEWVDSKGKKHKDADSPRYKALGNSIALPFWQWMAERITAQLKNDGVENPTMGSLFDGIGGFPLVFQRSGVKPVWASEIEEFPIAVTKRRFPEDEHS